MFGIAYELCSWLRFKGKLRYIGDIIYINRMSVSLLYLINNAVLYYELASEV